jgi:hypothetical protein
MRFEFIFNLEKNNELDCESPLVEGSHDDLSFYKGVSTCRRVANTVVESIGSRVLSTRA